MEKLKNTSPIGSEKVAVEKVKEYSPFQLYGDFKLMRTKYKVKEEKAISSWKMQKKLRVQNGTPNVNFLFVKYAQKQAYKMHSNDLA